VSTDPFEALSPARRAAAHAAVSDVLGSGVALTPISGGASGAFVFRAESERRRVLLRVEGTPSPLRNPHQYVSQRIAAEAGIAPKLLYLDEANGVSVSDYVDHRPLGTFPGGAPALMRALGDLLRRLQATAVFPFFVTYPDIVTRLFEHLRRTGLFAGGLRARDGGTGFESQRFHPDEHSVRRRAVVDDRLGVGVSQRSPRRCRDHARQSGGAGRA
jgi:hypothetical protein